MKRFQTMLTTMLAILALAATLRAEPEEWAGQLSEALSKTASFTYNDNADALVRAEEIVVNAAQDPAQRAVAEGLLLEALDAAQTREGKDFLCRQLFIVGSARAIPRLEAFLTDPETSHMARYVLARLEDQEAIAALHRALGKTSGALQAGIAGDLGRRRYEPAIEDLAALVESRDPLVAEASARALGKIGSPKALGELDDARIEAGAPMCLLLDEAMLNGVDLMLSDGRSPVGNAVNFYERLYSPERDMLICIGALRGLVAAQGDIVAAAQGDRALPVLLRAVRAADARLQTSAIGFVRTIDSLKATRVFADILPTLSPEPQALLARALGERNDAAQAGQALAAATQSAHEVVRTAALEALGHIPGPDWIDLFARAAASAEGDEQRAARTSLARLEGPGVDAALIERMEKGKAPVRVEMLSALTARRVSAAADGILEASRDADAAVRAEAIRALGVFAPDCGLEALAGLALEPKSSEDLPEVQKALAEGLRRMDDKESQAPLLLESLGKAPNEAKPAFLSLLPSLATSQALAVTLDALGDSDAAVRDAALRALAEWPNAEPADDLLKVAQTSGDSIGGVLALRGYIRMAGMSGDALAMYRKAMELARTPEDRTLVLGGLGSKDSVEALEIVEKHYGDEGVQTEAGAAGVRIAERLGKTDAARAQEALKKILSAVANEDVQKQAQSILDTLNK